MKELRAIDDKMIDLLQDGYLWLYDRTGIYIATVSVAMVLLGAAINSITVPRLALTAVLVATFVPAYIMQDRAPLAVQNARARLFRGSPWRLLPLAMFAALLATPRSVVDFVDVALICMAACYMPCLQVREREPKSFFERRRLAGASR